MNMIFISWNSLITGCHDGAEVLILDCVRMLKVDCAMIMNKKSLLVFGIASLYCLVEATTDIPHLPMTGHFESKLTREYYSISLLFPPHYGLFGDYPINMRLKEERLSALGDELKVGLKEISVQYSEAMKGSLNDTSDVIKPDVDVELDVKIKGFSASQMFDRLRQGLHGEHYIVITEFTAKKQLHASEYDFEDCLTNYSRATRLFMAEAVTPLVRRYFAVFPAPFSHIGDDRTLFSMKMNLKVSPTLRERWLSGDLMDDE
jgi:hypothetical protein